MSAPITAPAAATMMPRMIISFDMSTPSPTARFARNLSEHMVNLALLAGKIKPYGRYCLILDHNARGLSDTTRLNSGPDLIGYFPENCGMGTLRQGRHDGLAGIGTSTDFHVERHLAQERHAQAPGFLARTAMTEYL